MFDFSKWNQTSWRFFDQQYNFEEATDPWYPVDFPERVYFEDLTGNEEAIFTAIKIGDINGNARTNELSGKKTRSDKTLKLLAPEANLINGKTYSLAITSQNFHEIVGYQFTLDFDTDIVSFATIEAGTINVIESNFGLMSLAEGMITTSWNLSQRAMSVNADEVLFTIIFLCIERCQSEFRICS